ncbi:TPA-induced transmembrane protein [Astyanax mexicanus]|uniref:TPA-induced transmembrane protein n=1 Tax=Astyanax mexicanus TaxID=7994 RepID=UPI0020CB4D9E|nr:TPA-induced transmembrane protein [Astyanax mexicanus]
MEETEMELKPLNKESARPGGDPDNNNVENEDEDREVNQGNGIHLAPETMQPLLSSSQSTESNGGHITVEVDSTDSSCASEKKPKVLKNLKKELNETVFWKIKLWMAILIFLVSIISLILLLLFLCSGQKDDADDKYDRSSFVVPLKFTGTFTLANYSRVQDPVSQAELDNKMVINLGQKLTHIYESSPTLERYFSLAQIETIRQKDATVEFKLVFKMPEENKQLKRYILSREMVYSVLLQNLFELDTEDQPYIVLSSLSMEMVDN